MEGLTLLQSSFPEACETFLDLVWVVGNEIETNEKGRERHSSPEWQQLCRFVKAIAVSVCFGIS